MNSVAQRLDRLVGFVLGVHACHLDAICISTSVWHASRRPGCMPGALALLTSASSVSVSPRSIDLERLGQRDVVVVIRLRCVVFCPTIREIACLMRARSVVNGVAGARRRRSRRRRCDRTGCSRSMKALAALAIAIAPPKRMFGWSIAITISRPPIEFSLVL